MLEFLSALALWVKVIAGLATIVLAILIFRLMEEMKYFEYFRLGLKDYFFMPEEKQRTMVIWKRILTNIASSDPALWKAAVIDGDKMINEVLKIAGYKGITLEQRLTAVEESAIPNIAEIRKARSEVYERLAQDGTMDKDLAKWLLREYRAVFQQMHIIN